MGSRSTRSRVADTRVGGVKGMPGRVTGSGVLAGDRADSVAYGDGDCWRVKLEPPVMAGMVSTTAAHQSRRAGDGSTDVLARRTTSLPGPG